MGQKERERIEEGRRERRKKGERDGGGREKENKGGEGEKTKEGRKEGREGGREEVELQIESVSQDPKHYHSAPSNCPHCIKEGHLFSEAGQLISICWIDKVVWSESCGSLQIGSLKG